MTAHKEKLVRCRACDKQIRVFTKICANRHLAWRLSEEGTYIAECNSWFCTKCFKIVTKDVKW